MKCDVRQKRFGEKEIELSENDGLCMIRVDMYRILNVVKFCFEAIGA